MSIKFLVLEGGGILGFFLGGGECRFYFYGREDFSELVILKTAASMARLSPNTVGSVDWFQEWLKKEAHRFSQSISNPYSETQLGLSPSTVGSPDWSQEWLGIMAHRFSQSLFKPYSETP